MSSWQSARTLSSAGVPTSPVSSTKACSLTAWPESGRGRREASSGHGCSWTAEHSTADYVYGDSELHSLPWTRQWSRSESGLGPMKSTRKSLPLKISSPRTRSGLGAGRAGPVRGDGACSRAAPVRRGLRSIGCASCATCLLFVSACSRPLWAGLETAESISLRPWRVWTKVSYPSSSIRSCGRARAPARKWSRSAASRETKLYAAACMDALMKRGISKDVAAARVARFAAGWPRVSQGEIKESTVANWRDELLQSPSNAADRCRFESYSRMLSQGPRANAFLEEVLRGGPVMTGGVRRKRKSET